MGQTPYLDQLGFTEWLAGRISPEQLVELNSLVEKSDGLIDKLGTEEGPGGVGEAQAYTDAIERWCQEGCGGSGINTYADLFGSYRDLYNLFEIAKRKDPTSKIGVELLLLIKGVYEILPVPSLKEISEG